MKENRVLHGLIKTGGLLLVGVAAMLVLSFAHADKASAASYQKIERGTTDELQFVKKVGSYYFYTENYWKAYCSAGANGPRIYVGDVSSGLYTNGQYVVSIADNGKSLQRRSCATGKIKVLKKLKTRTFVSWQIQAAYKNRFYLNQWHYPNSFKEYIYDLKTGKMKRTNKNYDIATQCGSRMITSSIKPNEMYVLPLYLCAATKKGFKKSKTLAKYGGNAWRINNKFYYVKYTSKRGDKATLYRCKPNGKGRVKLGSFTGRGTVRLAGGVWISPQKNEYCDIAMNNKYYHYYYGSKNLVRFDPNEDDE